MSLADALEEGQPLEPQILALLRNLLNDYPVTVQRLLESADSSFKESKLASEMLLLLQKQQEEREALPSLRELAMTSEMRLVLASIRRTTNRQVTRHAEEQSIFAKIFKAQHFKYANRTSVEMLVGAQTVQETSLNMEEFSIKTEFPVTELTDPITARLQRRRLWKGDLR